MELRLRLVGPGVYINAGGGNIQYVREVQRGRSTMVTFIGGGFTTIDDVPLEDVVDRLRGIRRAD